MNLRSASENSRNKDVYSKVFAVDLGDSLFEINQDALTSDWKFVQIDLPDYKPQEEGPITEINAHTTRTDGCRRARSRPA